MKRGDRSKSRLSKVNPHDGNVLTDYDHNGSINLEIPNTCPDSTTPSETSKKRCAAACTSNEFSAVDRSPPKKKRLLNETTKSSKKRQNEISVAELSEQNPTKVPKTSDCNYRVWTQIINSDTLNVNSNCESGDRYNNFVVVSYNVGAISQSFYTSSSSDDKSDTNLCNTKHKLFLEELDFINADIICLQHVGMRHWKVLEISLKEKDYIGHIIFEDDLQFHGVATFHRSKRFTQISVDCGKFSQLCFQNIHHNYGLENATVNAIKKYLEEPEVYSVTLLRDSHHHRLIIVGNTRLSNNKNEKPDLKCVQAVGLFWQIFKLMGKVQADRDNNNQPSAPSWVLCGDFNDSVDSPVYQICRDGYPSEASINKLQAVKTLTHAAQSSSLIDLIWHSFQHPFRDSYSSYLKEFEIGEEHIWLSKDALQARQVLLPASCSRAVAPGDNAPTGEGPSSLACDVAFVT